MNEVAIIYFELCIKLNLYHVNITLFRMLHVYI